MNTENQESAQEQSTEQGNAPAQEQVEQNLNLTEDQKIEALFNATDDGDEVILPMASEEGASEDTEGKSEEPEAPEEEPEEGDDLEDEEEDGDEEEDEEEDDEEIEAPSEERVQELLDLLDKEGTLSDEQVAELRAAGYEVEVEGEDKAPEEEPEDELDDEEDDFDEDFEGWTPPEYTKKLESVYPDVDFSDPANVEQHVDMIIDDLSSRREDDAALYAAVKASPELAAFLKAVVADKRSLAEGLLEAGIDPNEVIPKPGEDGYDDYMKRKWEMEQQSKESEKFKDQRTQNLQASAKAFDTFLGSQEMEPGDQDKFSKKVNQVLLSINDGNVNQEIYQMIYDAMFMDRTVERAKRKVEVKARNEEIRKKRVKVKKSGDGIKRPSQKSTSDISGQKKPEFANDGSEEFMKLFGSDFS